MSRSARRPQSHPLAIRAVALAVLSLLTSGYLAFGLVDFAAGQEEDIQIHRMANAKFEGFPDEPVFIAIAGTDDRPGVSGARADALHVVGINPQTKQGTLIDIPRDTFTELPGRGRSKINNSHTFGGAQLVGETVAALTGANVQFVVTTNFEGFVQLVKSQGGVDADVPIDVFDSAAGAQLEAGPQNLNSKEALAFSRARKAVPGGDFTRSHHQGILLLAALAQVAAEDPGPGETMQLVAELSQHLRTTHGVDIVDMYHLARLALSVPPDAIEQRTMPGTTGTAGAASVVFPTAEAGPLFADFADDAVLNNSA